MTQLESLLNELALAKDCTAAAELDRKECDEDVKRAEGRLCRAEWKLRDCVDAEDAARRAFHKRAEEQTTSGIEEAERLMTEAKGKR